jgi:hypothetical protein
LLKRRLHLELEADEEEALNADEEGDEAEDEVLLDLYL